MADVEDCITCRFWDNIIPTGQGRCRRRAPVAVTTTFIDGLDRVQMQTSTEYPITGEAEWCGEFVRAEGDDVDEAPTPMIVTLCVVCKDGENPKAFENAAGACPACGFDGLPF